MTEIQRSRVIALGLNPDDFAPAQKTDKERIADLEAQNAALMQYMGVLVKRINSGAFEVVKDMPQTGDYTDPIHWGAGTNIIKGLWYYLDDKELPHEAIASGAPSGFYDTAYFDFIE